MTTVVERIQQFNQNRKPELLDLKYQTMRENAFAFLRGTCHLFYKDLPASSPLNTAPPVWVCGDLHLENFGSYKGNDRLVYFDVNDFDEAALAPCTWDLARFLTSILVAAHNLKLEEAEARALCQNFLIAYTKVLAKGQVGIVNRETATGLVKELLQSLKKRKRKDFLNERTKKVGKTRRLLIDEKTLAIDSNQRDKIEASLEIWAAKQKKPKFFRLLDAAYRVAGTGSLGLERYILLVKGNGSPDSNYLLDLKTGVSSSLQPYVLLPQPYWATQAERIVTIQQRLQWAPPALLDTVSLDGQSYVLRELQPTDDAVKLEQWNGKLGRLRKVIETMAGIAAWGHLLSSGQQGPAIAGDLIAFAQSIDWHQTVLTYAHDYAIQVEADYETFRHAKL
ncbi:DUF2252 domain-containing protein [Phormidium sp. FACHB-592]|uniref:DUF2252 domain-containing protein n=1 Tax=Stenomitos frigidus AS-A4 TaxID=2933935 RepID=A0ABV0KCL0_9CYAN|nr:DUF2252 domain-containing protein [Phormidium sp. FACHB-592]MBD2077556.1 DUF2252 domain-containing protein [Phormidium sp. FACHB-592]